MGSLTASALVLVPGLPFAFAMVLLLARRPHAIARFAPLATAPAFVTAFVLPIGTGVDVDWMLFGSHFELDEAGKQFLIFTATIWLMGTWQHASSGQRRSRVFTASFQLAMAGNLGVVVAADAVTFYLFFALMSFAAYGLIVENADASARRAGRIYMLLVICGEVALFAALVMIVATIDPMDGSGFGEFEATALSTALIVFGFGIKAGLVPVHVALPLTYAAAPSSARLVLAGAMLNAGVLGWLRFLPFGSGAPSWGEAMVLLGAVSVFYGTLCGVGQRDPRALLGYSSVSQMGYVAMLLGAGLVNPGLADPLRGALVLFLLHHAFAKSALFWGHDLLSGGTKARRVLGGAGLAIASLALVGAPFTSGALAKAALATTFSHPGAPLVGLVTYILPIGAVATTLLMARFIFLSWYGGRETHEEEPVPQVLFAILILLVLTAAWTVGVTGDDWIALAKPAKLWAGAWPVAVGLVIAGTVWAVVRRWPAGKITKILPGDILNPIEAACRAIGLFGISAYRSAAASILQHRNVVVGLRTLMDRGEARADRPWASVITGTLLLVILLGLWGLNLI